MTRPTIVAYPEGNKIRLKATFRDAVTEALADPTAVVCRVRKSNGTVASPVVTKDGVGLYHADVSLDIGGGTWHYRFEGTGVVQAADDGAFFVRKASV